MDRRQLGGDIDLEQAAQQVGDGQVQAFGSGNCAPHIVARGEGVFLQQCHARAPRWQGFEVRQPDVDGAYAPREVAGRQAPLAEKVLCAGNGLPVLIHQSLGGGALLEFMAFIIIHGGQQAVDIVQPHQAIGSPVACTVQGCN